MTEHELYTKLSEDHKCLKRFCGIVALLFVLSWVGWPLYCDRRIAREKASHRQAVDALLMDPIYQPDLSRTELARLQRECRWTADALTQIDSTLSAFSNYLATLTVPDIPNSGAPSRGNLYSVEDGKLRINPQANYYDAVIRAMDYGVIDTWEAYSLLSNKWNEIKQQRAQP